MDLSTYVLDLFQEIEETCDSPSRGRHAMSSGLSTQWTDALSLTRRRAPELYQSETEIEPGPHADAIRLALVKLRLAAVFCIEGVPTIGFLVDPDVTPDRIHTIHRILWNQGLMSLLLVIKDDELIAYSLVQRPFHGEQDLGADPRLIMTLSLVADALKLRELIGSTESGRFWFENDRFFDPANRVDSVLLANLLQAFREMKGDLGNESAQALLMQAMFIAYLEDRKIIKSNVFQNASRGAYSTFSEMLQARSPAAFERLFVWLKKAFNGNVFNAPCAFEVGEINSPKLTTSHLQVLARFRHGREEMASGQMRLWGYDFQYMPIALISAVYDRFLKEEEGKKNAEGAFYTPMFLADVVVNQVWDEFSDRQRASGIFCDPACGSGIFLVRLFQRLVAYRCRAKKKRYASWNELTTIARRLHGGDVNASAVRVAAFSLYIAMLEYSNPPDLPALIEKGKLLPSLYLDTLRPAEDFFSTSDEGRYDAVIGNPPWKGRTGQITTAQRWAKEQGFPDPAKDIAWGFVWKALKVVKADGIVGLLLPAMGILHNTSNEAQAARRLLLRLSRIQRIINLSDLCFQLFDSAQRPTAFVVYRHAQGSDPYHFEYWCPKADLNSRLKRLLTLARSDRTRIRSDHIEQDPSLFKRRLWTRSPDEKLLQYLLSIPALGKLIKQYKELRGREINRELDWVIGQGFKPAHPDRLLSAGYHTTSASIVTRCPYLDVDSFQTLALPKINAKPWPDAIVHRGGFLDGFAGPHIIIPQGVERSVGRVRAAYTDQDLVFQHSLQAIAFPPAEHATAKLLTAILNSRLAAWFYFHETANLGTDRAKVIQGDLLKLPFAISKYMPDPNRAISSARKIVQVMDDEIGRANDLLHTQRNVFNRIDSLVYDYYGLDDNDVSLIEDSFKYIIPAMQPRRSAGLQAIWGSSQPKHRIAYANTLCDALRPWFNSPIKASLAAKSADSAIVKLTLSENEAEHTYVEEADSDLDHLLREIGASLSISVPGNVQLVPDLRFVIGQDMYLVKPIQLRYWLRSSALADAEQIAAELSAIVARAEIREVSNARR